MAHSIRIVQAQLNCHVGQLNTNLKKHIDVIQNATHEHHADAIVFPELSLTGYPPEDLLLRPTFIKDTMHALDVLCEQVGDLYCLVGHPYLEKKKCYNVCSVIHQGRVIARYKKQRLPNDGVFDEQRYFHPGNSPCVFSLRGIPTGIVICEDLWRLGPTQQAYMHGAKLLLSPNASPFENDKHERRLAVLSKRAKKYNYPIIYVNQVGGQDELVFDGSSMLVNAQGELCYLGSHCKEECHVIDLDASGQINPPSTTLKPPDMLSRIYDVLTLGLRDYVHKNNFKDVLIGVSGGIDSALTLAIAVDALGSDHVHAVVMPSRYTSHISIDDADALIKNLDVKHETISIEPTYQSMLDTLQSPFANTKPDITEENIQARVRGMILMALSNKFGRLVLTTGNRSELAVGYCTLYGDMVGAYGVLKNIPKTMVYALSHYRNELSHVIPKRILERAPSAELAPNQTDQDTLPPYEVLDALLDAYLNQSCTIQELIARGFEETTVRNVIRMIKNNEYKRKQSAIGPHISAKSFMKDWRYPITNGYEENKDT